MTRRVTVCMSYGESRTEHVSVWTPTGRARITLARYVTACGRVSEDDESINHNVPDHHGRRPVGMCPKCWAHWRSINIPKDPS